MIIKKKCDTISNTVNNVVGINADDVGFVSQLLTTNLYTNPLQSFIRETTANAVDATKEANSKEPVLIYLDIKTGSLGVHIRDYGTGLSPERFDKIYKNIGSSTKRDSNDYIGAFGIGRFSVLSWTSECSITSYYNNKKYEYMMYLGNNRINIDLINTEDTDEPNGLKVSAEKKLSLIPFKNIENALKSIMLLNVKIYVEDTTTTDNYYSKELKDLISSINDRHFNAYNTFYTTNVNINGIEMGGIIYSYPNGCIPDKCVIKLPVGSLTLIPSRESIQLNSDNATTIDKHIKAAKTEIINTLNGKVKEVKNTKELVNELRKQYIDFDKYLHIGYFKNITKEDIKQNYLITELNLQIPEDLTKFIKNMPEIKIKAYYSTIGKFSIRKLLTSTPDVFKKENKIKKECLEYYKSNYDRLIILTEKDIQNITLDYGTKREIIDYILKKLLHIKLIDVSKSISIDSKKDNDTSFTIKRINNNCTTLHKVSSLGELLSRISKSNITIICKYTNNEVGCMLSYLSVFHNIGDVLMIPIKVYSEIKEKNNIIKEETIFTKKNRYLAKIFEAIVIWCKNRISYIYDTNIRLQFKSEYSNIYDTLLSYYYLYDRLKPIIEIYENNNWLNKSQILYYAVSEKDVSLYEKLNSFKKDKDLVLKLIKIYFIKKYGNNPKILTYKNILK